MRQHQLLQTHTHNRHFHKMPEFPKILKAFPDYNLTSVLVVIHIVASLAAAILGVIDFYQFDKKDDEVKVTDSIIDGFTLTSLIVLVAALSSENNVPLVSKLSPTSYLKLHIIASAFVSGASTCRLTTGFSADAKEKFLESFPYLSTVVLILTGVFHNLKW